MVGLGSPTRVGGFRYQRLGECCRQTGKSCSVSVSCVTLSCVRRKTHFIKHIEVKVCAGLSPRRQALPRAQARFLQAEESHGAARKLRKTKNGGRSKLFAESSGLICKQHTLCNSPRPCRSWRRNVGCQLCVIQFTLAWSGRFFHVACSPVKQSRLVCMVGMLIFTVHLNKTTQHQRPTQRRRPTNKTN